MRSENQTRILIVSGTALALVCASFYFSQYVLLAIPFLFLLVPAFFYKPDLFFFSLAIFTPLSINPSDAELGKLSLSLPTEPIAVVLVLFFFLMLWRSDKVDRRFLLHPISWILYFYFIWLAITSMTSVDKVVSIKFMIAKIWFIVPGYFLAGVFFREKPHAVRYLSLFVSGMVLVSLFNLVHLSFYGFEDKPSQWTMQPFFKDHAILGGILAIAIPIALGLMRLGSPSCLKKSLIFLSFLILTTCLIFTYSRAAWASVVPALLLFFVLLLRIKFKWILLGIVAVFIYGFSQMDVIIMDLERNKVAGSDDIVENAESISNISTDPSNLERINRWASAIEMWKSRPVFGYGPGTYMFEYAPFQLKGNYTSISTNFGDVGNAHSEYLGPLAETGLLGLLIFVALLIATFAVGFRAYYRAVDRMDRILISTAACALVTYFTHGFLNNYLDTDKASFIFWPLIAILVVMDLKSTDSETKSSDPSAH
ncbi:MAG TPA: O-antigen ligase family protein [Saprospiraceae bacterium]|nr:O-antigen ligase family protein [Saprospiraceae bacterium]